MQQNRITVNNLLGLINHYRGFIKKGRRNESAPADPFDLDTPLLTFGSNAWTARDAMAGTAVFGATGAGKSSGPGKKLAMSFLRHQYGFLVLCAKNDEADEWHGYAKAAGREDDVITIEEDGDYRFNVLQYELTRSGKGAGKTTNMVKLCRTISEMGEAGQSNGGENSAFWKNAEDELLTNIIDALKLSGQEVTFLNMQRMMNDAPKSLEQVTDENWQEGFCFQVLNQIADMELDPEESHTADLVFDYWTNTFASLDEKTRSIITSGFTGLANSFVRGPLKTLFSSDTTITPEAALDGKILIVNLPVKEYGHLGVVAAGIFKYCFQQAVERRNLQENARPVVLWADEAQYFLNSYDQIFQTTARSSRCATCYLSQSISNYLACLKGKNPKDEAESLLGNLATKIFCANNSTTNEWAAKLIGRDWGHRASMNSSNREQGGSGTSFGLSEQMNYLVDPIKFSTLKNGGPANGYIVEAFLTTSGKVWNNGMNYLKVRFNQLTT